MTEIVELQDWFARQCGGSWNRQHGISVETLDNPGWWLQIDLRNTDLEEREMVDIKIECSEDDWIVARRSESIFEAFGGPQNLKEMVRTFFDWEQGRLNLLRRNPDNRLELKTSPTNNNLDWLSRFFLSLCNGDWEHGFGCRMKASETPGWHFTFDLSETVFEEIIFPPVVDRRTATDWVDFCKEGSQFVAIGGVGNLDELIGRFRKWIEGTEL